MTFEDIVKANKTLSTMDIKGKDYVLVNERVKAFRMLYPNGRIDTELLSCSDGVCVFKATVYDDEGRQLGSGHAYEKESSSYINKTSYIENCETSAVGRALGFVGLGIDTSIASYEEVKNAVSQQMANDSQIALINKLCEQRNVNKSKLAGQYKVSDFQSLTAEQAEDAILRLGA